MSRLIDADALIDALRNTKFRNDLFLDIGYKNAINIIESLPSVQYFLTCEGCKWLRLPNGCANDRCARMYKDRYKAKALSEEDKVICKLYLDDLDSRKSCNEYKTLMSLLDSTTRESGHWIVWGGMDIPENHGKHKCSVCGEFAPVRYEKPLIKEYLSDFCPNCGADMRGERDE